ncbi:MAG: porin [Rhodospirillales bacterium]
MKKVLLGATALTAAGAFAVTATSAKAEFDLSIKGWQNNAFIYTSTDAGGVAPGVTATEQSDANAAGASMYNQSEINFFATQKLDNGLTIVSRIELETSARDGGNTDEVQVHINGGFGQIQLGGIDTANDLMHHGVPSASLMGLSATSYLTYLGLGGSNDNGHFNTSWNLGADDALGVGYYTPRIAGFQAGVTFSPNVDQANGVGAYDGDASNAMAAGMNFTTEMSGVGFNASVGGGSVKKTGRADMSTLNWGVNASYMGFGIGFDMAHYTGGGNQADALGRINGNTWQAGLKYGQGPWAISYGYMSSKQRPSALVADDIKTSMHEVAAGYNLGPGVDLGAAVVFSSHDRNDNGNIGGTDANGGFESSDGVLGITSLTVSF